MPNSYFPESLYRKYIVRHNVMISVTGAAIHTPFIPKRTGKRKMQIKRINRPLEKEIIADAKALPIAVK